VDDYVERTGLIIKSGSVSFKRIKEWCDQVYSDVILTLKSDRPVEEDAAKLNGFI